MRLLPRRRPSRDRKIRPSTGLRAAACKPSRNRRVDGAAERFARVLGPRCRARLRLEDAVPRDQLSSSEFARSGSVQRIGLLAALSHKGRPGLRCSSKHDIDSRQNHPNCSWGKLTHARRQGGLVDCYDLRHVRHAVFRESARRPFEFNVSGSRGPFEITGDRDADNGRDSASIEAVALNDDNRPTETWGRPIGIRQVGPPNFALFDYQSTLRSVRRAVADTKRSGLSSSASIV